jgi:hypothetical protein
MRLPLEYTRLPWAILIGYLGDERPQPPVTLPPAPWIEKAPLDESEIKQTAARFDRHFQAFLDSGVFAGPE